MLFIKMFRAVIVVLILATTTTILIEGTFCYIIKFVKFPNKYRCNNELLNKNSNCNLIISNNGINCNISCC